MKLHMMVGSLVLCAVTLVGCGDDKKDKTNTNNNNNNTASESFITAFCQKEDSCAATRGRTFADAATCKAFMLAENCEQTVTIAASDAELQACVTAIASMDCAMLDGNLPVGHPCNAIAFTYGNEPMANIGESCEDTMCAKGSSCKFSENEGTCSVCVADAGLNGDCTDVDCLSGYYCDSESFTCKALLALDATCTYDDECLSDWCNETTSKCAAQLALGDTCTDADRCAGDMECEGGTCKSAAAAGASCTSVPCAAGAVCVSGICQTAVACGNTIAIGSPCVSNDGCVVGAYCDYETDRCAALKAAGADCYYSSECAAGLECDYVSGTCMAPLAEGDACGGSTEGSCATGLFCDYSLEAPVCTAPAANGAACEYDFMCASDYCDTTAEPAVCAEPVACVMP